MNSPRKEQTALTRRTRAKSLVASLFAYILISCALLQFCGCNQPGETAAEGHRRHLRNLSINQQGMMQDIDTVLMADQPSKLTDKRAP